jgi:DNA invertase Pin-like site-specific DNA recombinase
MTTYIYARVSTAEQDAEAQADFLKSRYQYDHIVEEHFTGTTTERPKFKAMLAGLKAGDWLIVREVSRLGRNSIEVLSLAGGGNGVHHHGGYGQDGAGVDVGAAKNRD